MKNSEKRDLVRRLMRVSVFEKFDGPYSHHNRVTARFQENSAVVVTRTLEALFPKNKVTCQPTRVWGRLSVLRRVTIYIPVKE